MIGERIKMARHMKGLSQRALGEASGVSAMAISKYENGHDMPSSGVLVRLAKALGIKTEFFLRPVGPELKAMAFRCRLSMPRKQEQKLTGQVREWVERYMEAESLLPSRIEFRKRLPVDMNRFAEKLEDIEGIAVNLRNHWGLGLDPVESMIDILEDRGVKIGLFEACREFDACTFYADEDPVIALKDKLPGDRQFFNLAHELGHLLMLLGDGIDEEKAAHRFAGAFLVPRELVYEELGHKRHALNLNELYLLKRKYKLSMQAWVYRAKDLGIIGSGFYMAFFKYFRSNDFDKREPFDQIEPDKPKRMEKIILHLLAEEVISESKAVELLGSSYVDVATGIREIAPSSLKSAKDIFSPSQYAGLFWPLTDEETVK
ncbi:MAG: helix-turn-helix domain-containing protein [Actinomycetota bacterium]|nr:helix-turn-helix domain-containing protein [Actinomycetota bacterium]